MNIRTTSRAARQLLLWAVGFWLCCPPGSAQEKPAAERTAQFLPSTLGKPLTVVPIDMPDVECQVLEWKKSLNTAAGPTLTLLCPPEKVFAPLRVLIKLAWLERQKKDTRADPEDILVVPGEITRLRTRKESAFVQLDSLGANGKAQKRWVPFTAVADVALLPRFPKRPR